jgi:hypothetical protein
MVQVHAFWKVYSIIWFKGCSLIVETDVYVHFDTSLAATDNIAFTNTKGVNKKVFYLHSGGGMYGKSHSAMAPH